MKNVIISVLVVIFIAIAGVCIYFGVTKTPVEDVIKPGQQTEQPADKPGTSTPGDSTDGGATDGGSSNGEIKISLDQEYILFS